VARLAALLKSRDLYDGATIVLIGDRGEEPTRTLDEAALRVALMVKQPASEGAGRRVEAPVQQIDLVPTLLDLVRAPVPGSLSGRSLRAVLTDEKGDAGRSTPVRRMARLRTMDSAVMASMR
jgi:arylsulfatase A-like enzyme